MTGRKEERLGEKRELSCRFSQILLLGVFPDLVFPCRLNQHTHTHTHTHIHTHTHSHSHTHTLSLDIFKLCHPSHTNPNRAESAVLRRILSHTVGWLCVRTRVPAEEVSTVPVTRQSSYFKEPESHSPAVLCIMLG